MARKVNKSEEVRRYMAAHRNAGPSAVADALKKYNISANYVSNVKLKMKNSSGKKGRRGQRRNGAAAGAADLDAIRAAASFIKSSGGIDAARQAFKAAEQIASVLA